ncbi:astacin-like metalloendopeptidase [Tubulanus polymorphus]|uniref:astacin-like metalloendopeptidase n=1 Tax=Tubulanus polymorphus TaxID=672921 RepID=UPI003DA21BAC
MAFNRVFAVAVVLLLLEVVEGREIQRLNGGGNLDYPETEAGLFQGDIVLDSSFRSGVPKYKLWPNNTLNYRFIQDDSSSSVPNYEKPKIEKVLNQLLDLINKDGKCLSLHKWQEGESRRYLVVFTKQRGCYSSVGWWGGEQFISLGNGCLGTSTMMHEMLHVIGLWHEQSRHDRDDYVTINWENIQPGGERQFSKAYPRMYDDWNMPYDYGSIMHYGRYYYSKNGKPTITPKQPGVKIGMRGMPTATDIKKVRVMYGCDPKPQ